MKILIVEDELPLLEEISGYLSGQGFLCEQATTYLTAEDKLTMYEYAAVLLDITLPGGTGLDLLRQLKSKYPATGVLIISAKNSLDDKLTGLDLGADDYLTKPFHLAELNARVHALLRRNNFGGSDILRFHEISIDTRAKTAACNHKEIDLTRKEYELLLYFAVNKGRVLSKQAIAEHLWGDRYDMADSYDFVYVHINNLRKKLLAAKSPDYIRTIYGMGYKFSAT
jgi:DNA-binding response OmpR family regulator